MDKKLLFALVMTSLTLFIFNYFTYQRFEKTQQREHRATITPGQSFKIPTKEALLRPTQRTVDFVDDRVTTPESRFEVNTELYTVTFSNYGGVIAGLDFKKRFGKYNTPLRTIYPQSVQARDEAAFLVGFSERTPYLYTVSSSREESDYVEVVYQGNNGVWALTKRYRVHKNAYTVDLELSCEPMRKDLAAESLRLFVPMPVLFEIAQDKQQGMVFNNQSKNLEIVSSSDLENVWAIPEMFGGHDRYFAHSLIRDENRFAVRAYYKQYASGRSGAILESAPITEAGRWNMRFYLGPKDLHDMTVVDKRLEGLLNFGWFSWICKLLLRLLEWIYTFVPNYGLAIIVLTILVKLPFLPLSLKSAAVMEQHQKYRGQIERITRQYKEDIQARQQALMQFYKDHNLSPAGQLVGCLPLLIDVPIMYSLYSVLGNYMDLYQAPFFGWIADLSSHDPYYILPILMGATMFWQQSQMPKVDEKQKVMFMFLPLLFTGMFASAPSGLVLYWTMRNIVLVFETVLRKRILR